MPELRINWLKVCSDQSQKQEILRYTVKWSVFKHSSAHMPTAKPLWIKIGDDRWTWWYLTWWTLPLMWAECLAAFLLPDKMDGGGQQDTENHKTQNKTNKQKTPQKVPQKNKQKPLKKTLATNRTNPRSIQIKRQIQSRMNSDKFMSNEPALCSF